MRAIILNGISGNLKSSISERLEKDYGCVVIGSVTGLIYKNAERFLGEKYPILTETHILYKLIQWESFQFEAGKTYVFEKTLFELLMYNQWMMSNKLMYNVSTAHQFDMFQLESIKLTESKFFNKFSSVSRYLLQTRDYDFIEKNLSGEDVGKRSDTFWDADHYLLRQSEFEVAYELQYPNLRKFEFNDMRKAIDELDIITKSIYNNDIHNYSN